VALVMDGAISTVDDLRALDSAILETSTGEGIDLTNKLRVAEEALHLELAVFLLRAANQNGVSGPGVNLGSVAVTAPLRRWHSLRTLVEVYSDAYNSQFNDRYLGKWKHYSKLTRETSDLLFDYGVGIIGNPVPRAPKPAVTAGPSGGAIGQFYVRTAWRGPFGASGALSETVGFAAPDGERFIVDPGVAPAGVTGFDVYAGADETALTRQNSSPILAGSTWTLPPAGLVTGPAPLADQKPDHYIRRNRAR
jgi:hypothetical protein